MAIVSIDNNDTLVKYQKYYYINLDRYPTLQEISFYSYVRNVSGIYQYVFHDSDGKDYYVQDGETIEFSNYVFSVLYDSEESAKVVYQKIVNLLIQSKLKLISEYSSDIEMLLVLSNEVNNE